MLDKFYAYLFIRLLTKPWKHMDAFKAGLIDDTGNIIKKPETDIEKRTLNRFVSLVFRIRKIIEKFPLGNTPLVRYAAAIALLRESVVGADKDQITETFMLHYLQFQNLTNFDEMESFDIREINEEVTTGDIDIADMPLGTTPKKKKKSIQTEDFDIVDDNMFAGATIFNCNLDTIHNCRFGRRRYQRFNNLFSNDVELGEKIKHFSYTNPNKKIILRDKMTGAMVFLKR